MKENPGKYIYIDDGCFRADGRMREVILPPNCKIIGREAFFQCQIRKEVVLPKTMKEIKRPGVFRKSQPACSPFSSVFKNL